MANNPLHGKLRSRIPRGLADFTTGSKGANDPRSYRAPMRAGAPRMAGRGLAVGAAGGLELSPGQESLLEAAEAAGAEQLQEVGVLAATATPMPRALSRSATALTITTTVAEETFYTTTIPAGTLVDARTLRLRLLGQMLNNSGAARTYIMRVKLGGTTIYDDSVNPAGAGIPVSALVRLLDITLDLSALGSSASQMLWGTTWLTNLGATTVGRGDVGGALFFFMPFGSDGATAINMDVAQDLVVTIQPSFSSASYTFTRRHSLLEVY